jgi:hypothetical protein
LLSLFEEGEQVGVELLLPMGMIWSSSPWTIKVGAATGLPAAGLPKAQPRRHSGAAGDKWG